MERNVRIEGIVLPALGGLHALDGGANRGLLGLAGCTGGEGSRAGLDGEADLAEVDQQLRREPPLQEPSEHVGIEQVPAVLRLHPPTPPRPCAEQSLRG